MARKAKARLPEKAQKPVYKQDVTICGLHYRVSRNGQGWHLYTDDDRLIGDFWTLKAMQEAVSGLVEEYRRNVRSQAERGPEVEAPCEPGGGP